MGHGSEGSAEILDARGVPAAPAGITLGDAMAGQVELGPGKAGPAWGGAGAPLSAAVAGAADLRAAGGGRRGGRGPAAAAAEPAAEGGGDGGFWDYDGGSGSAAAPAPSAAGAPPPAAGRGGWAAAAAARPPAGSAAAAAAARPATRATAAAAAAAAARAPNGRPAPAAASRPSQPAPAPPSATAAAASPYPTGSDELVLEGVAMSPAFEAWCRAQMTSLTGGADLALPRWLMSLASTGEVAETVTAYLGESPGAAAFTAEFLRRKGVEAAAAGASGRKARRRAAAAGGRVGSAEAAAPAVAIKPPLPVRAVEPPAGDGWVETTKGKRRGGGAGGSRVVGM